MSFTSLALGALVILTFPSILRVRGQNSPASTTNVANSNPQISYSPEICSSTGTDDCIGSWWDTTMDNGVSIKTTAGPSSGHGNAQTILSYSFYGSRVEIHGLKDTDGANMIIQVDDYLTIVNTSTGIGGKTRQPSLLLDHAGLDSDVVHTLSIGWSANTNPNTTAGGYEPISYVYFDHLAIDNFRAAVTTNPTSSSSTAPISSSPSDVSATVGSATPQATSRKLKSGAIVGITIAIILFFAVPCTFCLYFLCHRRRFQLPRRRPASPHIRVMIESQESRHSDDPSSPPPGSEWKARPHLSLPPAYPDMTGSGSDAPAFTAEKEMSYLDLESGSTESTVDTSSFREDELDGGAKGKSRLSLLAVALSPSRSPRVSRPPHAKLRINTRNSVLALQNDPFARYTPTGIHAERGLSPVTPYTPYLVGTAVIARPQNAQLVSNTRLGGSSPCTTSESQVPPVPPLPTPYNEKRRLMKYRATVDRSGENGSEAVNIQISEAISQLPSSNSGGLEMGLGASVGNARPSFDRMSIMTRSVPPPYALCA